VTEFLSYWLLAGVLLHAGAHVALVVGLLRATPLHMGLVAIVLPPLAPYYGWRLGMRKRTYLWLVGLGAYAAGVALANL
jgi:hypothetical protein